MCVRAVTDSLIFYKCMVAGAATFLHNCASWDQAQWIEEAYRL
jgi:hypothetical protein